MNEPWVPLHPARRGPVSAVLPPGEAMFPSSPANPQLPEGGYGRDAVHCALLSTAGLCMAAVIGTMFRRVRRTRMHRMRWQGVRQVSLIRRSHKHDHEHDDVEHGHKHDHEHDDEEHGHAHSHERLEVAESSDCASHSAHSHSHSHSHSHTHDQTHSHSPAADHHEHGHDSCCGHGHSHGEVPDWLPGAPAIRRLSDLSRKKTSMILVTAAFLVSLLPWGICRGLPGGCMLLFTNPMLCRKPPSARHISINWQHHVSFLLARLTSKTNN